MSKRPNDMKNAFQALRVNQPLRLPKDGPGLVAPKEQTQVEAPHVEAPFLQPTQVKVPPPEDAPSEAPHSGSPSTLRNPDEQPFCGGDQNEGARNEPPRSRVAHFEAVPSIKEREPLPKIEFPQTKAAQFEHALSEAPRDENELADELLPPFEVTRNEVPRLGETPSGFFRLAHTLFREPVVREMSGDCFRLFLWMSTRAWRYPDSTGVIRASVRFIEEETGMGHATVSRALKSLKDARLIQVVEVDYKRGNTWHVVDLAVAGPSPEPGSRKKRSHIDPPRTEATHLEQGATSPRARSRLKMSGEAPQNEEHYKKFKNLNKHSQEALRSLLDRAERNIAPRKRVSEIEDLDSLLSAFSIEQIETAVRFVEEKGTLRGEFCHSPFNYLTFAIADVLKRCVAESSAPILQTSSKPAASSDESRRRALQQFTTDLTPNEQERFIQNFVSEQFPHEYKPPQMICRALAAAAWTDQQDPASRAPVLCVI